MLRRGVTKARHVAEPNIAFRTESTKTNSRVYAEARFLRILWWKWLRERPLPAEPKGRDVTRPPG
jgi:hypothetical protein